MGDVVIQWLEYVGSAVVGALVASAFVAWVVRKVIEQFLKRDIEAHKIRLKHVADIELKSHEADLKRTTDLEVARLGIDGQRALAAQKAIFDQQMLMFQTRVAAGVARDERVRLEIEHWANPILGAVRDLQGRLGNILHGAAYVVMAKDPAGTPDRNWSIDFEYFFPTTVFLFAQYFCWVRLLEERLRFDLFQKGTDKKVFFDKVHAVGQSLSSWPHDGLKDLGNATDHADRDRQVFNLQQRAIGEAMIVGDGEEARCMRAAAFVAAWRDETFRATLAPLTQFLEGVSPETRFRWRRLELMTAALEALDEECVQRLSPAEPDTAAT